MTTTYWLSVYQNLHKFTVNDSFEIHLEHFLHLHVIRGRNGPIKNTPLEKICSLSGYNLKIHGIGCCCGLFWNIAILKNGGLLGAEHSGRGEPDHSIYYTVVHYAKNTWHFKNQVYYPCPLGEMKYRQQCTRLSWMFLRFRQISAFRYCSNCWSI